MRSRRSTFSLSGFSTKTVSERFISRAIRIMTSSPIPSASGKTARGLPQNARSVKTSNCTNRYSGMRRVYHYERRPRSHTQSCAYRVRPGVAETFFLVLSYRDRERKVNAETYSVQVEIYN